MSVCVSINFQEILETTSLELKAKGKQVTVPLHQLNLSVITEVIILKQKMNRHIDIEQLVSCLIKIIDENKSCTITIRRKA